VMLYISTSLPPPTRISSSSLKKKKMLPGSNNICVKPKNILVYICQKSLKMQAEQKEKKLFVLSLTFYLYGLQGTLLFFRCTLVSQCSSPCITCTLGGFNVSNLMGITWRMIDIGKKITFYFLQNV
jgi:hypothetical protein